ncbi:DUF4230 domain-containing protein [Eubacterium sp. MSJ-21]|nr:DUF4230 domain-containing protein [Eubacterium sp. MSJ-21]
MEKTNKKIRGLNPNRKIKRLAVFCLVVCMLFSACGKKEEAPKEDLSLTQMKSICELATLKCYYHNVAKITKEKDVLWWDTTAELWIEYSGIVKLGVDITNLDMQVDGSQVTITMPKAKVLSCQVDQTSLDKDSYYTNREGLGAEKINADDQTEAIKTAQENMLENVQSDESLLQQAQNRAQDLLEQYVKNVGDAMGKTYEVSFVTAEDAGTATDSTEVVSPEEDSAK